MAIIQKNTTKKQNFIAKIKTDFILQRLPMAAFEV